MHCRHVAKWKLQTNKSTAGSKCFEFYVVLSCCYYFFSVLPVYLSREYSRRIEIAIPATTTTKKSKKKRPHTKAFQPQLWNCNYKPCIFLHLLTSFEPGYSWREKKKTLESKRLLLCDKNSPISRFPALVYGFCPSITSIFQMYFALVLLQRIMSHCVPWLFL